VKPGPLERQYRAALNTFLIGAGLLTLFLFGFIATHAMLTRARHLWQTDPTTHPRLIVFGAAFMAALVFGWLVPAILRWIDRKRGRE